MGDRVLFLTMRTRVKLRLVILLPLSIGLLCATMLQTQFHSQSGLVDFTYESNGPDAITFDLIELGHAHNVNSETRDIDVIGDTAYVADGNLGLVILDVTIKAAPIALGICDTPGAAFGVHVSGDYAYIADYEEGLQIIDVSTSSSPSLVSVSVVGMPFLSQPIAS